MYSCNTAVDRLFYRQNKSNAQEQREDFMIVLNKEAKKKEKTKNSSVKDRNTVVEKWAFIIKRQKANKSKASGRNQSQKQAEFK